MCINITQIGLILDVVGVVIIIYSELKPKATRIKNSDIRAENYLQRLPFWFSRKIGSTNMVDSEETVVDTVIPKFWGFFLLFFGFIFQFIGSFSK